MGLINLKDAIPDRVEDYGPLFKGAVLELAQTWSAQTMGFHLEVLDPGTFSSPYHWHTGEEEICVVIEGEAMLRKSGEFFRLRPGDLVFHGTGPESVHHMYNHTNRPFRFLALSSKFPGETCHYPDSRKTLVRDGKRVVMQDGKAVDYWKDEEDPRRYWPTWALEGRTSP